MQNAKFVIPSSLVTAAKRWVEYEKMKEKRKQDKQVKKVLKLSDNDRQLPERYGQYCTHSAQCYDSLIEPETYKCAIELEDKELW